jgi:hypothetical protein
MSEVLTIDQKVVSILAPFFELSLEEGIKK